MSFCQWISGICVSWQPVCQIKKRTAENRPLHSLGAMAAAGGDPSAAEDRYIEDEPSPMTTHPLWENDQR